MCGICGYISTRRIAPEELKAMNDTMVHRGPDDAGEEIYPAPEGYAVGFAQRRLSILDLSELGHQPMESASCCFAQEGQVSIVYNGEIQLPGIEKRAAGISVSLQLRYGNDSGGISEMGDFLC